MPVPADVPSIATPVQTKTAPQHTSGASGFNNEEMMILNHRLKDEEIELLADVLRKLDLRCPLRMPGG